MVPVDFAMARSTSTPWAIGSLIAVNLMPLVGVLFFGWSTLDLMLLYWFENAVVGFFALLKILLARGSAVARGALVAGLERLFVAGFFVVHYGMFWVVHGVFVMLLFGGGPMAGGAGFGPMAGPPGFPFGGFGMAGAVLSGGLLLTVLGLIVSHAVSFVGNVLQGGEDLDRPPNELMGQPYGRVMVLHVTLVLGAFLMLGLGEPLFGLALFVLLKTGVDLAAHLRSHAPRPA